MEVERSVGRPHREIQDCGAGTLISCHLHSLKAPCLCTAAQDTKAIHCSQQKVLGRSLCPPRPPRPPRPLPLGDGPVSLESQTPRVEGPCGPAPWVRTEGGKLSPGPRSRGRGVVNYYGAQGHRPLTPLDFFTAVTLSPFLPSPHGPGHCHLEFLGPPQGCAKLISTQS